MTPSSDQNKLTSRLAVDMPSGAFLGATRIRLLEAIAEHGSISRAAKAVPLSYKAAWDALDTMNNLAPQALVERSVGGRQGGGTRLTDYGQRMVALFRALESEYQAAMDRLSAQATGSNDVQQFRNLLRKLAMKTSARNQFAGAVAGLSEGQVNVEVLIRLDEQTQLVATVTRESAEQLGLTPGREVFALIKASSVLLATGLDAQTTARNQLWGEVCRIHEGPVNAEVVLALPSGRYVTAVVTHDSVANLDLAPGKPACAVFQESAIILATVD